MRAIIYQEYGPPEVLKYKEVEKPSPGAGEVLVKIHASSINFGDRALVRGKPFITRMMGHGLLRPQHRILGTDLAGEVVAVGAEVKQFRQGDQVFADVGRCGFGAFAEFASVPENALAIKPSNTTFEEAAAVPQAASVALQGLRDQGQVQRGDKVLIIGASGGIGTFAVQIAGYLGAEVTGVCSTSNLELVRSLGADHVLDYTREDFSSSGQRYDLIFDIVANRPLSDYKRVLTPQGLYLACAFNPTAVFLGPLISKNGGQKAASLVHTPRVSDLDHLKEILEKEEISPVIDRCYPLSRLPEAMQYMDTGHSAGKVVITISGDDCR
jgi:NADPH:quinone reductase-like Zn-dependent oxidoreductase